MELLSKYVEFKNGKKRPDTKGLIPVYGGNGILDYTNVSNMDNGVVIGRVGAYRRNVFFGLCRNAVVDVFGRRIRCLVATAFARLRRHRRYGRRQRT